MKFIGGVGRGRRTERLDIGGDRVPRISLFINDVTTDSQEQKMKILGKGLNSLDAF